MQLFKVKVATADIACSFAIFTSVASMWGLSPTAHLTLWEILAKFNLISIYQAETHMKLFANSKKKNAISNNTITFACNHHLFSFHGWLPTHHYYLHTVH